MDLQLVCKSSAQSKKSFQPTLASLLFIHFCAASVCWFAAENFGLIALFEVGRMRFVVTLTIYRREFTTYGHRPSCEDGAALIVVRPLSSVLKFGNLEQDALTAGRALRVDSVLDGSVQRWGDKIRVNAGLLKVTDGTLLWTGTFDEKFTDIFVVQDAVSNRVVAALALELGGDERVRLTKHYTENVEAYGLYTKGRFHAAKLTPAGMEAGVLYFRQAVEIDPSYALAYAGLAEAYRGLVTAGEITPNEFFPKAKAAAQKAIEIGGSAMTPEWR